MSLDVHKKLIFNQVNLMLVVLSLIYQITNQLWLGVTKRVRLRLDMLVTMKQLMQFLLLGHPSIGNNNLISGSNSSVFGGIDNFVEGAYSVLLGVKIIILREIIMLFLGHRVILYIMDTRKYWW